MTMTIEAVYEAGVFRPLKPLELKPMELPEGEQVKLTVNAEAVHSFHRDELTEEEIQARLEIVQAIIAMPMETGGQEFAGTDHDKILYGSPEGAR